VLIGSTPPWLPEVIEAMPRLRWIHFLSAGVDAIWAMPFDKRRYRMSKSSGVHAASITEYVLGAVLYALKRFGTYARQQQRREWRRIQLDECAGKTLGIVGLGTIGRHLAEQAQTFGLRVVGTVRTVREVPHVAEVYGSDELERVLAQSDFVVLLVPLTDETRGLIGARELAAMKESAWMINVARGDVVDEGALEIFKENYRRFAATGELVTPVSVEKGY
jgi:phosphoglycerate dehydrogenase-like enzyme